MHKFLFDFRSIYAGSVCTVRNRKIAPWNRTGAEDKRNYISLSGRLSEKLNYYISVIFQGTKHFHGAHGDPFGHEYEITSKSLLFKDRVRQ